MGTFIPKHAPADAADTLRALFPKGSTVHTVLRHVSSSGMTRRIGIIGVDAGDLSNASWLAAAVLGYRVDDRDFGLIVRGAGMDMGFHVVYSLSQALYGDGYALNHRWI